MMMKIRKQDLSCLTGDTRIMTTEGLRRIQDLVGRPFHVVVGGHAFASTEQGFWHSGKKPVFRVRLWHGMEIRATQNHRFLTQDGWKQVDEMTPQTDALRLSVGGGHFWTGNGTMDEGYIAGFLIGNKVYYSSHIPMVSVLVPEHLHPDEFGPIHKIQMIYADHKKRNKYFSLVGRDLCYKQYKLSSFLFKDIAQRFDLFQDDGRIHVYEEGSYDFTIGLLKGLFDASGIVYNLLHEEEMSLRLWEEDRQILHSVQRLLLAVGIVSRVTNMDPHGHELLIRGVENMNVFIETIGFLHNEKQSIVSQFPRTGMKEEQCCYSQIMAISECPEDEDVYDCTIDHAHCFSANGVFSHNCAEQNKVLPKDTCPVKE